MTTKLPASVDRSKSGRVTGRLAEAIELMIEEGKPWDDAARTVGMSARSMRKALDKPHVIAFLRARKQVFRALASAGNISALVDVRQNSGNAMARVQAVRALEQLEEQAGTAPHPQRAPGVVIVIESVEHAATIVEGSARAGQEGSVTVGHGDVPPEN
jgi:hypothetical protein